ncbi:hypothetical protein KSP40_PGU015585 [Platanthera guangdongensis]|uniref:Myb/SANT-like DNA-binding domain-containing protein n=1 Tax=Platanthera guangdongensis TaxID=2320717 RepID=A0ABR2LRW5_9ASPA
MDDDDDPPSHTPSPSSSYRSLSTSPPPAPISVVHPSAMPPLNGHPSDSVTVAAPAPNHQTLTLALPIQHPPGSSGSGREDCWSDGATSALIDAWGEHFLELSRGNLKQKHWQEVADVVSSRNDYTKPPRTDIQCKNRIDTLKKKYKLERTKMAAGGLSSSSSSWPFYNRLDFLLGPVIKIPPSTSAAKHPSPAAVATAARSQFPQKQRTNLPMKRKAFSPPAAAFTSSTSDSLPPITPGLAAANGRQKGIQTAGMRELTRAILKFGEVYHKVESSKLQQAMEMEKQRMGFARELEMQRMQFFMKTQMELSQLRPRLLFRGGGGGGGGGGGSSNNYHHHSRRHHHHPTSQQGTSTITTSAARRLTRKV